MMPTQPVRAKERFLVFGSPQITQSEIDEVRCVCFSDDSLAAVRYALS